MQGPLRGEPPSCSPRVKVLSAPRCLGGSPSLLCLVRVNPRVSAVDGVCGHKRGFPSFPGSSRRTPYRVVAGCGLVARGTPATMGSSCPIPSYPGRRMTSFMWTTYPALLLVPSHSWLARRRTTRRPSPSTCRRPVRRLDCLPCPAARRCRRREVYLRRRPRARFRRLRVWSPAPVPAQVFYKRVRPAAEGASLLAALVAACC